MVTCLCNVSISCLCEKLYSGAHFHFLPFVLLKLVCVNVDNVCKHWQCNNVITNSSFFNSFNAIFFILFHFLFFFSIDFVAFFYMFLEKSMFVSTLVILFLGVFCFSNFFMHPCCKSELFLHNLQNFLHLFFLRILCLFSLTSFMSKSIFATSHYYFRTLT